LAAGDAEEARKMARYLLRRHPDAFRLYRPLSRAHVALGELSEAHQADAEYLAAIGRYRSAIKSLKLALRDNAENSQYINQSLKSRLTELERLDSARKKRNNG
jgi:predicted Zn-dependent protease